MTYRGFLISLAAVLGVALGGPVLAQGAARTVNDGVFTAAQAERGKAVYANDCAMCHGPDLTGGGGGPTLSGPFWAAWNGRSVGDLFNLVKGSMPSDGPGRLSDQEYADILAYLLSANRLAPGQSELPAEPDRLSAVAIVPRR
jgi:quinoprotein glucose dehydrogenase